MWGKGLQIKHGKNDIRNYLLIGLAVTSYILFSYIEAPHGFKISYINILVAVATSLLFYPVLHGFKHIRKHSFLLVGIYLVSLLGLLYGIFINLVSNYLYRFILKKEKVKTGNLFQETYQLNTIYCVAALSIARGGAIVFSTFNQTVVNFIFGLASFGLYYAFFVKNNFFEERDLISQLTVYSILAAAAISAFSGAEIAAKHYFTGIGFLASIYLLLFMLEERFKYPEPVSLIDDIKNGIEDVSLDFKGIGNEIAKVAEAISEKMNISGKEAKAAVFASRYITFPWSRFSKSQFRNVKSLDSKEKASFVDALRKLKKLLEILRFNREQINSTYHIYENYDGTGIPEGLSGEKIPVASRVARAAEEYKTETLLRKEKETVSDKQVIEHINNISGKVLDPRSVKSLQKILIPLTEEKKENRNKEHRDKEDS